MIERANRKVFIIINGIDKTAEYRFKCDLCKHMSACDDVSGCKHIKYVADHTAAHIQSETLDNDRYIAAVPANDAAAFAKIRTIVERTHRKRMYPYAELCVKIK
ncbi:MAG: hypothetical protein IKB10_03820 [Alphaproteobacteria bacterium]|nr:hypothetical protein [Alphaproteobacteria bacterium]